MNPNQKIAIEILMEVKKRIVPIDSDRLCSQLPQYSQDDILLTCNELILSGMISYTEKKESITGNRSIKGINLTSSGYQMLKANESYFS